MIKDTFFSLPRFMNLCRKEMVENWKSNVLRMVLMYGVMAVVMVWNGYLSIEVLPIMSMPKIRRGYFFGCFYMGIMGLRLFECFVYNGKDENENEPYFHVNDSGNSF